MSAMLRQEFAAQSQRHFKNFVEAVTVCDEIQQRENAALRAQVHDLTELLAGYDLCGLQNPYLEIVRDRAYRRNIASDGDLLQAYQSERRLQQQVLEKILAAEPYAESGATRTIEITSDTKQEVDRLRRRVEALELMCRSTTTVKMCSADSTGSFSSVPGCGKLEPDAHQRAEVERLVAEEDQAMTQKQCERATKTVREQQQKIAALEHAVAAQLSRNESLERENRRFLAMVTKLHSTFDTC